MTFFLQVHSKFLLPLGGIYPISNFGFKLALIWCLLGPSTNLDKIFMVRRCAPNTMSQEMVSHKKKIWDRVGIQHCSLLIGVWKRTDQTCSLSLHLLFCETNSMLTALRWEFPYNVNTDDCHWGNIFHSIWWRVSLALGAQMHSAKIIAKSTYKRNTLTDL